jgi:ubiquinone/menaquinone biosynthesis C-methylase UbiE
MKKIISQFIRSLGLIQFVDRCYYGFLKIKTSAQRKAFKAAHPEIVLPPDYALFETFDLDYNAYYFESIDAAHDILTAIQKHIQLNNDSKILDWGCGSGRLIRHMPKHCSPIQPAFYGTDYNEQYINWNQNHLPGISFHLNSDFPPLPYPADFFDAIYGISIFTHFSEAQHVAWFDELKRILKPGGVLYLTFQVDAFKIKLNTAELKRFNEGQLVIKSKTSLGHRTYSAYQPASLIEKLSTGLKVLEKQGGEIANGKAQQQVWLFTK